MGVVLIPIQQVDAVLFNEKFGSQGSANGQFDSPNGVTVDSADRIIVADANNHRIQIFDSAGSHIQSFGSLGSADGQFSTPRGVTVDSADRIIVADRDNSRIQIFDSSGSHIQSFGSFGSADGQFDFPVGVTVDSAGRIIVSDLGNNRIQIFQGSPLLPISYWKAENNSLDSRGTNDVTLNGATFASSQIGTSFSFDGVDNHIIVSGTHGGGPEATVMAWVKTADNTGDFYGVVSSTGNEFVHLQLHHEFNMAVYTDAGFINLPIIPKDPVGVWKHVALSIQSGDIQLYVDGELFATNTSTFNTIISTSDLRIGSGCCAPVEARFFNGLIDEVKIFDIALDSTQICSELKTTITPDSDSDGLPDTCDGTFNISTDTVLSSDFVVPGNLLVENNSVLTINPGVTVTIPPGSNLSIKSGSGVLIKDGGTLQINS